MVVVEVTRASWILHILKIEPMGLASGLNARCEKKKAIKNES